MRPFIKIGILIGVLVFVPLFMVVFGFVLAGQTKELPSESLEATPSSIGVYTLEGKLLKIEGEVWVLEDLLGNQHHLQIGAETRLTQSPKQPGDSVHAVVRNNGQAQLIL